MERKSKCICSLLTTSQSMWVLTLLHCWYTVCEVEGQVHKMHFNSLYLNQHVLSNWRHVDWEAWAGWLFRVKLDVNSVQYNVSNMSNSSWCFLFFSFSTSLRSMNRCPPPAGRSTIALYMWCHVRHQRRMNAAALPATLRPALLLPEAWHSAEATDTWFTVWLLFGLTWQHKF